MKSAGVFGENFKLYKHSLGKMTGKLYIKLKSKKKLLTIVRFVSIL